MTELQLNVLRLMPCSYDGWAALPGQRPVRRSTIIDQLVSLGAAAVTAGMANRTVAGDEAIA